MAELLWHAPKDAEIRLTGSEALLLKALARHAGHLHGQPGLRVKMPGSTG
jgi:hypothetical protein